MKKFIVGILAFVITFEVVAKGNVDCSPYIHKSKWQFCNCMDKFVATGKALKLEPEFEEKSQTKVYTTIDIDKDEIYDEVELGCGSSGECGLSASLSSSGSKIWLNENLMFYLTKIGNDIYVPVVAGEKEDFPDEGSVLGKKFYFREKHLAKLYKLTTNKAVLVCHFKSDKEKQ